MRVPALFSSERIVTLPAPSAVAKPSWTSLPAVPAPNRLKTPVPRSQAFVNWRIRCRKANPLDMGTVALRVSVLIR